MWANFRAVVRLGAGRISRDHLRYFADRGLLRKDYADSGFQTNGYINENWFSSTHEGKRRSPRAPRAPLFCGSKVEDEDFERSMRKQRRMGDARRRFEEGREAAANKQEEDDVPEREVRGTMQAPDIHFDDEIIPEMDLLPASESPKKNHSKQQQKQKQHSRKVFIKGRVISGGNYVGFKYSGSGLDQYTSKMQQKEDKRRKHQNE